MLRLEAALSSIAPSPAVILGLDPRIRPSGAQSKIGRGRAWGRHRHSARLSPLILGSSPRMTVGKVEPECAKATPPMSATGRERTFAPKLQADVGRSTWERTRPRSAMGGKRTLTTAYCVSKDEQCFALFPSSDFWPCAGSQPAQQKLAVISFLEIPARPKRMLTNAVGRPIRIATGQTPIRSSLGGSSGL